MDVSSIPLLSLLKERMAWLSQRQDLLSQNVANADTPGYTAHDLKPVDFEQALRNVTAGSKLSGALAIDDPRHIALKPQSGVLDDGGQAGFGTNSTGNSVSLEDEMIKVSETQAQFQAASNLYAKAIGMMKTAIGKTGM